MPNMTTSRKNSKVYLLEITPQTHVRSTQDETLCFKIFGHLYRINNRSEAEQEALDKRIASYPFLYKRFLQLERYNDYKRRLREEAAEKGFYMPDAGMQITFYIPVPPSWRPGKKKKFHLQPHLSKPDADNLEKAMIDGLRPQQDCSIWHTNGIKKLWFNEERGLIRVEVRPVSGKPEREPRTRPRKKKTIVLQRVKGKNFKL
jgi:Holliday junction resolvase RusA-like endonuclease